VHFDLTSTSLDGQQQTVGRALELGGRHIDIGQRPEEGHVVLADPEGNEFCVIEPGNSFLAECGFVGALAGDGSQQVGYFWSEALGWPLVWDQDRRPRSAHRTAVRRSPGAARLSSTRREGTACTSTSLHRWTAISMPRSIVWSPSERLASTPVAAVSAGWS